MEYPMSYPANKLKRKTESSLNPVDSQTAACVTELMNAATSFHKLHLKVEGLGSFSAHNALNELYDALPGHADAIAEGYQGACEKILQYEDFAPRILNNVEDALSYLREMKLMINGLQEIMPHSEIVNDLDNVKSTINSIKYKLLFLK
jgi:DNA-binding ferritin-like protein